MVRAQSHDTERLVRFVLGDLAAQEQLAVEKHFSTCVSCRDFAAFVREFNACLRQGIAPSRQLSEPCPDPMLLIALRDDELDPETAQHVRVHTLYCKTCCEICDRLESAQPRWIDIALRKAGAVIDSLLSPIQEFGDQIPAVVRSADGKLTFSAPFRSTHTITDPDTGVDHTVTFRVEDAPALKERVKIALACAPAPDQWWVSLLNDSETEITGVFLTKATDIIDSLPLGTYSLKISKDEDLLVSFSFSVELFRLDEALETAICNLEARQYGRALAILDDAIRRDPECREAWAVRSLALALVAKDTEAGDGQAVRNSEDFGHKMEQIIAEAQKRYRDELGTTLAAALISHPSAISADLLDRLASRAVSITILPVVKLVAMHTRSVDDAIADVFVEMVERLEQVQTTMEHLQDGINLVRRDVEKDVDEKFLAFGRLFDEKIQEIEQNRILLFDYSARIRSAVGGDSCWEWLGADARRMFTEAEGVYSYHARLPIDYDPDFTPGLLEYCRGLELLLNEKIGSWCTKVHDALLADSGLCDKIQQRLSWMDVYRVLDFKGAYGINQVVGFLRIGKVGGFGSDVERFLKERPLLSSPEFVEVLTLLGVVFRNGKVHPEPGSSSMFTDSAEMWLFRKVIVGLDEHHPPPKRVLGWIKSSPRLKPTECEEACKKLNAMWARYPGVVRALWQAMEPPSAVES